MLVISDCEGFTASQVELTDRCIWRLEKPTGEWEVGSNTHTHTNTHESHAHTGLECWGHR